MQNVSCPSCGAQVQFRSTASIMAVCEYCKATILKDADSVKDLGKMSDVLEDYSPIQIGTSGVFGGHGFTVIGRIQLRWSAGLWNEWSILFDDGRASWLSDSSGLYTLTTERSDELDQLGTEYRSAKLDPASDQLGTEYRSAKLFPAMHGMPAFNELVVARSYPIAGKHYTAAEIRIADCIGGQGELPFKVGQGWQARVADFRCGTGFLTLDYSDSEQPKIYTGQAVILAQLQCQLLRDDDAIKTSAGKFRGKIDRLGCPSCGGNINYLPGLTTNLICPSCQSQIDTSASTAQVLAAGERVARVHTTLELGAQATIGGVPYELIGVMRRVDDENTGWTEYLLHSARAGFLWLVETDDGWARATVQDDWPLWNQGDSAQLGTATFRKLYEYPARVVYAAGAFNWRVRVGDSNRVIEFESGPNKLAAEMTSEELTWSLSSPVPADQIRAWFGEHVAADKGKPKAGLDSLSRKFMIGILALNAIPLLMNFGGTWLIVVLALAAVYLPAKYLSSLDQGGK